MAVYRYVNVHLPSAQARLLADLYGMANDLRVCRDYCQMYIKMSAGLAKSIDDIRHVECFSAYAFIKYGRCFKGGVRVQVQKQLLSALSPEDMAFHQLVVDIRDKHIAHSVNNFESPKLRVWLNPEEQGKKINSISVEIDSLVAPEPQLFERLKCLIDKFLAWILTEQKQEEERLIQFVAKRYDLNELYSLQAEVPHKIDYLNVRRPRSL